MLPLLPEEQLESTAVTPAAVASLATDVASNYEEKEDSNKNEKVAATKKKAAPKNQNGTPPLLPQHPLPSYIRWNKAASKQSQKAVTQKRSAFNIDDETAGRQTKKQKITFKHEIPSKSPTTCGTEKCSKQAISSYESNLNPGYYL